jgi:hypothetical protein
MNIVKDLLFLNLNPVRSHRLIFDLQIRLEVILILKLLFSHSIRNNKILLQPCLSLLKHSSLSPLMINWIQKLPQIELLNLNVESLELLNGQLRLDQILILQPAHRNLIDPNLLII